MITLLDQHGFDLLVEQFQPFGGRRFGLGLIAIGKRSRDENGQPGPMEQSIMGTEIKDAENPYEIVRIARSFDPCLACSVHTVNINGERLGKLRVV